MVGNTKRTSRRRWAMLLSILPLSIGAGLIVTILTRVSLLLGIYKALHILYADDALADRWLHLPNANPLFGGRPALALIMEAGIDGLHQVRRFLDGRRG